MLIIDLSPPFCHMIVFLIVVAPAEQIQGAPLPLEKKEKAVEFMEITSVSAHPE